MKKFLIYILILVFPFLIIIPFAIYFLSISGELMVFESYIHRLEKGQLWGLAYSAYDREYKFFMTEELKPDIVELGTSRSLQVDDNIFRKNYTFYNAGNAIQNPQDYLEFVKQLSYNPKLIIIDVNHFFFNSNAEKWPKMVYKKPQLTGQSILQNCSDFYSDLFKGKIVLDSMSVKNHIGMRAIMLDDGFSRSGFYNYGSTIKNPPKAVDYNMGNTLQLINARTDRYQHCNQIDRETIDNYVSFINECKKRKIMVLGFIPPFAHKVIDAMKKDGNYKYIDQIYDNLHPYFDGNTQFLYDYTDATKVGGEDYDFIDGHHAGVIVDNLIFKDIISKNKILANFFVTPEQIDSINLEYGNLHPKFHNLPSVIQ